jgi:2-C-methyl-D-erythritol 4-phosphate cytidylyltransferase
MPSFAVILPAAGRSSRFGGKEKKPFALLDGRPVWLRTVELFVTRSDVCQTILVVAAQDRELFRTRYAANIAFMDVQIVEGGGERFESVANALAALKPAADFVAVHDAVRPCLTAAQIDAVFAAAVKHGAALPAVPVADTLKRADAKQKVVATVPREGLWLAQTPQAFRRDWLAEAYARRGERPQPATDDAQLVEAAGHPIHLVLGAPTNIKITTPSDLPLAEAILKILPKPAIERPAHPFADEERMWR